MLVHDFNDPFAHVHIELTNVASFRVDAQVIGEPRVCAAPIL